MDQRGRKSTAALTVLEGGSLVSAVQRPQPPQQMPQEQAEEWVSIVERMPADWFPRETHGLLEQYCRHVVSSRRIDGLIERMESSDSYDIDQYDQLLKMREREGRAMSSIGTRMRITQQSTYSDKKSKPMRSGKKPWQG